MNEKIANETMAEDFAEKELPTTETERRARRDLSERVTQPPPAPPGDVPAAETFFPEERRAELKAAWLSVQSAFIDEPQRAVQSADALVKDILATVSEKFEQARRSLEGEWDKGGQASTEALRVALQRYRALFDRLLGL